MIPRSQRVTQFGDAPREQNCGKAGYHQPYLGIDPVRPHGLRSFRPGPPSGAPQGRRQRAQGAQGQRGGGACPGHPVGRGAGTVPLKLGKHIGDRRLGSYPVLQQIQAIPIRRRIRFFYRIISGGRSSLVFFHPSVVLGVIAVAVQLVGHILPGDKTGVVDLPHRGEQRLPLWHIGGQLLSRGVHQAKAVAGGGGVGRFLKLLQGALQLLPLYIADAAAFYSDVICHSGGHAVAPLLAQHLKSVVLLPVGVFPSVNIEAGRQDLAGKQRGQKYAD